MIDCLMYFGIFALVFIVNYLAMKQNRASARRVLIVLGFLILLCFIGFRYNVGTDYPYYLNSYNQIADLSWDKLSSLRMELLVAVIFKVCSSVLVDARLVFVVLGFLMLYPIYKVNRLYNYKYLAYSILAYCVLFLPFGLNGMRQGIAMSFMLLSIAYLVKGKIKNSLVNFVIAVLFHTSSMIMLPYMIIIYIRKWKKINFTILNLVVTGLIAIVVLFFLNNLLVDSGITQYSYMLGNIDTDKISLSSIVVYVPVVLMALFLGKNEERNGETLVYKNLTISGICFYVVGTAAQYLSRFGLFFMMPSIILLPKLVQEIPDKNARIIVKISFIVYLAIFFYVQYSLLGKHEILPYQTWVFEGVV